METFKNTDITCSILKYLSLTDIKNVRFVVRISLPIPIDHTIKIYNDKTLNIFNAKKIKLTKSILSINLFDKFKDITYLDCSTADDKNPANKYFSYFDEDSAIYNEDDEFIYFDLVRLLVKTDFTDNLSNLKYLTYLDCGNVGFSDSAIKKLINLTHLYCGSNQYITDNTISNLINLELLHCGSNQSIINRSLLKLTRLINLTCTDCYCRNFHFDDSILMQLTQLTSLNCVNNKQLTDKSLKCLTNLTYLDCGNNINFTNESFKHLTNLTYLNCKSKHLA